MALVSAGLFSIRLREGRLEILLAHPGGPFWAKKDDGVWTIPKGTAEPGEDLLATARREFTEETGFSSQEPFYPLGVARQKSGKLVHAWACVGDCDPAALRSNTFTMEWPPHSGKPVQVPEIDRVRYFTVAQARQKILAGQLPLLEALAGHFPDEFAASER